MFDVVKQSVALSAGARWAVVSRAVAAILGGYVVAALFTAAWSVWLPGPRAEATLTAMMLSFAVHAGAVVWVFAARTAGRAWLGLAAPSLVMGAMIGQPWWAQ